MTNCDPLRDLLLTIALTAVLLPASALAGTAGALPFVAVGGVEQGAADNIASLVSSELDIAGDWELVISAKASEITDGCGGSKSCWQAFGKGEGHTHVITGTVGPAGDGYEVTAQVHDVKSGAMVRQVIKTVSRKPDLLLDQIPDLAMELATGEAREDTAAAVAAASKPKFEEPDFDDFEEEDEEKADKPKWMNRDRNGRLIKSEDELVEEDDPFGDLGDEDLDLDELDSDTQRKKADERREREAREAARKAEEDAERQRVEDARRKREDDERRRAEEDRRRREDERRQAEEDRRRRDDEEKKALAERERRDELRRLAEEREREEEDKRRAADAERRREDDRRAAREAEEEARREESRSKAAAERREEERREAAALAASEERDRADAERRSSDRRRADDERRREEAEAAEFALASAIESEDDGFIIEDDDPGFVIEEDDGDYAEEDDEELREGHIITYGEEEEADPEPVSRRRDDYDPYARARGFEGDKSDDSRDAGGERRERSYDRADRRDEEDDGYGEEDEEEGDFDRREDREDDRLAYNADGYPDRRRSYDEEGDNEVRARPSRSRYEEDDRASRRDDEDDEYGDSSRARGRGDYTASRSARASTTRRGPTDRQWVSVRLHGGYTNYYLHFGEFGLDLGVLVHPQVAIDVAVDFWAVGLTVLDEESGQEIQQVHTLPNFSVGGSWRGDFHKIVRPFVGADFTSTIYATVRRGSPDGPTEPRGSLGFMIKGGVDIMFLKNLGAHVGLKGGVMYAEEIAELVSAEWAPTQGVFNFNGGLSLRF